MKGVYHSKTAPPRIHGVVPRVRLFNLLDSLASYPVSWISSPAGSGKTTLVASYLATRRIPALWYLVDEADSDVASFFYYMAEAGKRLKRGRSRPLPLFTQEFRLGMEAFTRHYFDSLFGKMSAPGALVFDNYQNVAEDSEFHEVVRNGLKLIPEGIRVFIASRLEAPPAFVSLKADRLLAPLEWSDLRLTVDEVQAIMSRKEPVSKRVAKRVYEETQGWAAAVILIMDEQGVPAVTANSIGQISVFNYLAVEVFRKLDRPIKDFLCTTALLPSVSQEMAAELTGAQGSAILGYLARNHYFVTLQGTEYTYHPLFKEFLLDQGRRSYDAQRLNFIRVSAARMLARSLRIEEAVRLLLDAQAYNEVLQLILESAQKLLAQGRSATLEEWAERLPEAIREASPWLSYWLGMGRLIVEPSDARRLLEKAFSGFETQNERVGSILSAAGIMNSIFFEWDDYRPLDRWIDWVNLNVDLGVPMPSPETEALLSSVMVCALTYRMPWHPRISTWVSRATAASRNVEDPLTRCIAKGHVMQHYASFGDFARMRIMAEEFRQISFSPAASPLAHLAYIVRIVELHDWLHGSWDETFRRLHSALNMAEGIGAYFHLGMIYWQGIIAAFETENLNLVKEFLGRIERTFSRGKRAVRARYHIMSALYHLKMNELGAADQDTDSAVNISVDTGMYIVEAYARVTRAYVLRRLKRNEEAWTHLTAVERILEPLDTTHVLYLARLTQASLCFDESDTTRGRTYLRAAFRIGIERNYGFTLYWFWQPDEMARLCAEALAADIETGYAQELLKKNTLVPRGRPEDLGTWPWPCRIHTLGRFEIVLDEKSSLSSAQKRPLQLLKILISLGGKEVRQEVVEDELWPEARGDMARIAFKTNLSRLRKSLGEKAIEVKDGRVSLNPHFVWLDTWALESLDDKVSELYRERQRPTSAHETERLAELVCVIYQGDFLPADDEPWTENYRDRLRKKFLKIVEKLGNGFRDAGDAEKAVLLYENARDRGLSPSDVRSLRITNVSDH